MVLEVAGEAVAVVGVHVLDYAGEVSLDMVMILGGGRMGRCIYGVVMD